jgi:UDP-glucose 4-epimerase
LEETLATYLVTGGGGFIGSNIVEELIRRGENVKVLDNFSTGRRENIEPFLSDIELIEGDVRSYHTVGKAVEGVDFILHQAALPSVPRSIKDPISTNEVNVVGTLNILDAVKDAGVKRVVYASSSSIYGNSEVLPKQEDMMPEPLSPYAVSKLAGEKYCQVFSRIYNLETVCLRYFNVFGPKQDPTSQYSAVIPKFIAMMLNGRPPTIYGDGLQSRDFTFIANVVDANLLACEASSVNGEVINIACGESSSILDLVEALNNLLNTKIVPEHLEVRKGDVKHSLADIQKAKKLLNYYPKVSFKEGLRKTLDFYRKPLASVNSL